MFHNPAGDCNWGGRYEDIMVGRQIYIYHKLPVAYFQLYQLDLIKPLMPRLLQLWVAFNCIIWKIMEIQFCNSTKAKFDDLNNGSWP